MWHVRLSHDLQTDDSDLVDGIALVVALFNGSVEAFGEELGGFDGAGFIFIYSLRLGPLLLLLHQPRL